MKGNQLIRIESAMDILCGVLSETNGIKIYPLEVLDDLIGDFISEEEFGEIEDFYAELDN